MAECELMRRELDEAVEALADLVQQYCCHDESGRYDSMALSTNAEAMRVLAKHGRFVIETEVFRRVIGKFVETDES